MKIIIKFSIIGIAIFTAILLSVMVILMYGAWRNGYRWQEMDWDNNGKTSIREFIQSSDIGMRKVKIKSQECVEYFSLKDGMPVRTICKNDHR